MIEFSCLNNFCPSTLEAQKNSFTVVCAYTFHYYERCFTTSTHVYNKDKNLKKKKSIGVSKLGVDMKAYTLNEIQETTIERITTGFKYLDIIYGKSEKGREVKFGLPLGMISLWAGAPGVGKTRISTDISITVSNQGYKVLLFQNEVTMSQYKGWVKKEVKNKDKFLICSCSTLKDQLTVIEREKPDLVICDSVNMIEGYDNPKEIRVIMEDYKLLAQRINCHVIFIGHLNKENKVKGNNDLEYLIDISCKLYNHDNIRGMFVFEIGKCRGGISGGFAVFKHVENGIEYVVGSEDERWKAHFK